MRSYAYVRQTGWGVAVSYEDSYKDRLERLQVCVSKDIMDRCWNIASIDRVTVASLVEEALSREIDRREDKRGEPYPARRNGQSSPSASNRADIAT